MWIEVAQIATDTLDEGYDSLQALLDSVQVTGEASKQEEDPISVFIKGFAFVLPFLVALVYFSYKYSKVWKWIKGQFPQVPFSNENLSQAYISLTVSMISCDKHGQMQKLTYLRSFVRKFRSIDTVQFEDLIDRNFHYPIHPKSVCEWLKNNSTEKDNLEFVHFILSITLMERGLQEREYKLLIFISHHLGLNSNLIDFLLEQRRKAEQESNHARTSQKSLSKRTMSLEILDLADNATLDQIKSQYRNLAKKFHPDRFANDSEEMQEQAHQRFLEIQEAYEYLT